MKVVTINEQEFKNILQRLNSPKPILDIYKELYEVYSLVSSGIEEVLNKADFKDFNFVNPLIVILYIVNEFSFYVYSHKIKVDDYSKIFQDENFVSFISSICCDKYLTNEQLNVKSKAFLNKFNPKISTINLYLNFCLTILNRDNIKLNKYDNLVKDLLKNSLNLSQCIINLLISGFDVEAFSTWRTLHENECLLIVLTTYGKDVFDAYFKHIEYALAFRHQINDENRIDELFQEIKAQIKEKGLRSCNMKKFIEYGYLFAIKDKEFNVDYKLNFRDGVETLANLKRYSKIYELASEIAHSSPFLIYSNREYYSTLANLNLYDTFFRLENIFAKLYTRVGSKNEIAYYSNIRKVYLSELMALYGEMNQTFVSKFKVKQAKKNNDGNEKSNSD